MHWLAVSSWQPISQFLCPQTTNTSSDSYSQLMTVSKITKKIGTATRIPIYSQCRVSPMYLNTCTYTLSSPLTQTAPDSMKADPLLCVRCSFISFTVEYCPKNDALCVCTIATCPTYKGFCEQTGKYSESWVTDTPVYLLQNHSITSLD